MKLQCEVEVINRMLPSFGPKSKGWSSRAVLSIGKQPDRGTPSSSLYLLICTNKDRSGSKYKLKENIENFLTWFVEEGKATVQLKEPAIDICLSKADIASLKIFLSAARLAHRGSDATGLPQSALDLVCAHDMEKPKKKLMIVSKMDYPMAYPYSLEQLQVSYCRLSCMGLNMLSLRPLRRLDLSNNHIKRLPPPIGDLSCLAELILRNNQLESFADDLCSSTWQTSLQHLDLSQNRLRALPARFCQLRELVNLKLDDNKLVCLPFHIGRLSKLRFLSAAHNQLPVLPAGFRKLSLENLDLFGNPFTPANALEHSIQLMLPLTLQELAARTVLQHRISYGPHLIPFHLCGELDSSKVCECGRVCVNSFIRTAVSISLYWVSHNVVPMDNTEAPLHKYFCSLLCYDRYMDNCVQHEV